MDQIRGTLPKELIGLVIAAMNKKAKRMLRSTSKDWYALIKIDEFSIYFASARNLDSIIQHFSKHYENTPIGLSFYKDISLPIYKLSTLTQLTSLYFPQISNLDEIWINNLSTLTALTNLQQISPSAIAGKFPNLTKLEVKNEGAEHLPLYTNLRRLLIRFDGDNFNPYHLIPNPSKLTFLSLINSKLPLAESVTNIMSQLGNLKEFFLIQTEDNKKPISFGYLTGLDKLRINGLVSDEIYSLTRLTYLSFEVQEGTNPYHTQTPATLHNLKYLDIDPTLYGNDMSFLTYLTNLENFSVVNDAATMDALKWLNSQKLTRLSFYRLTEQFHASDLSKISSVEHLSVTEDFLNASDALNDLKCLTDLYVIASEVTSPIYTALGTLTSLKTLILSRRESLEEMHQDVTFENLTNLERLDLSCSPSDQGFEDLVNLTRLTRLQFTPDTDIFWNNRKALNELPLRCLILNRQLRADADHILWKCLTKLTALEHLSFMRVDSDDIIGSFSVLTNLTSLEMRRTRWSRKVRGIYLTKLTNLQQLHLLSQPARVFHAKNKFYLTALTRLINANFR